MLYTVEVQNLKCRGCANSILNALSKLEGVSEIEVNLENDTVTAHLAYESLKEQMQERLSDLGYPPINAENSIKHQAVSYVSCMIGKLS